MPLTTREAVETMAPELKAAVTDAGRWQQALQDADQYVNTDVFQPPTDEQAARYMVAHILTVDLRRGAPSPVQSVRAGSVTAVYGFQLPRAGSSVFSAWLESSAYGQKFLTLGRPRAMGPILL